MEKNYCANCYDISDIHASFEYDDHATYRFLRDNGLVEYTRDLYRSRGGEYVRKECKCTECGKSYDFLLS